MLTMPGTVLFLQGWTTLFFNPAPLDKRDPNNKSFLKDFNKVGTTHHKFPIYSDSESSKTLPDLSFHDQSSSDGGDDPKGPEPKKSGATPGKGSSDPNQPSVPPRRVPRTRSQDVKKPATPKPARKRGQDEVDTQFVEVIFDDDDSGETPVEKPTAAVKPDPPRRTSPRAPKVEAAEAVVETSSGGASSRGSPTKTSDPGVGEKRAGGAPSSGVPHFKKPCLRKVGIARYVLEFFLLYELCGCLVSC